MKKTKFSLAFSVLLFGCVSNDNALQEPDVSPANNLATAPELTVPAEVPNRRTATFAVYGNWCGLNYPKDISTAAPPIDELDATCMRHDFCYVEEGQYACACDQIFEEKLRADLLENKYQGKQQVYARSFHQYFYGSPCKGTPDGKYAASRALQNMYMNTTQKALGFYDNVRGANTVEEKDESGAEVVETENVRIKKIDPKPPKK